MEFFVSFGFCRQKGKDSITNYLIVLLGLLFLTIGCQYGLSQREIYTSIKLKTGIQQARKGSQLYVTQNVVCQMNFLSS